jgi:hypothetical protein
MVIDLLLSSVARDGQAVVVVIAMVNVLLFDISLPAD